MATEEIFGPVLSVMRAPTFEAAVELANATDYALTAGVLSRSPAHIRLAEAELRAGNVYVNRSITGAVVGRHPFGGYGLSGVGSKAGGPDYLLQFLEPRAVSENTLRQGFVPGDDDGRPAADRYAESRPGHRLSSAAVLDAHPRTRSSAGRAPARHAGGRWFKSSRVHARFSSPEVRRQFALAGPGTPAS